ncbi:MAG: hypothetical protein ACXWPM_10145 [Bdellovibrionota bacterium]
MLEKSHLIAFAKSIVAAAIAVPAIAGGYYILFQTVTFLGN